VGHADYYKHGDFNAICDVCGFKFKRGELRLRWDGALVCDADWEPRHPQELIRVRGEQNRLKNARPEVTDVFIDNDDVQPEDL